MRCVRMGICFLAGLALLFPLRLAHADQLDEVTAKPSGVLVVVDPATKTVSVYKAEHIDPTIRLRAIDGLSDSEKGSVVKSEVERIARPENRVAELHGALSELDREGTRPACWSGGWGPDWGWSGWGGYDLSYSAYWSSPWSYPGTFDYGGYDYSYGYGYGYGCEGYYPVVYYGGCGYGWYW